MPGESPDENYFNSHPMKIFLTGATGLLGRYFLESIPASEGHEILAVSRSGHRDLALPANVRMVALPFENREGIREALRQFAPEWVLHAGGEGNVDRVEKESEHFRAVNVDFSMYLMEECSKLRARWLTFSSNGIYDGECAPYSESSEARPFSAYGRFKVQVDSESRRYPGHWVIFRPTVSYGWNYSFGRMNPVSFFLPRMQKGEEMRLVDDQFENPVYAGDVAASLWQVLKQDFQGELNVGGGDAAVSRYEWMRTVARAFGYDVERVRPAKLADFSSMVPRPRNTSFDVRKLTAALGRTNLSVYEGALAMKADTRRRGC